MPRAGRSAAAGSRPRAGRRPRASHGRARARSASPVRPLPGWPSATPSPSSSTSIDAVAALAATRIAQLRARLWRTTFVVPSRTAQASTASTSGGSDTLPSSRRHSIPAASSAARAPESASPSASWRYACTASRTSPSACRVTSWISPSSSAARAGSRSTSFWASSLFNAITESVWPSRSCRSRAIRRRSSATASRASSSRASRSCWLA